MGSTPGGKVGGSGMPPGPALAAGAGPGRVAAGEALVVICCLTPDFNATSKPGAAELRPASDRKPPPPARPRHGSRPHRSAETGSTVLWRRAVIAAPRAPPSDPACGRA